MYQEICTSIVLRLLAASDVHSVALQVMYGVILATDTDLIGAFKLGI
jgi:hypothetical protein